MEPGGVAGELHCVWWRLLSAVFRLQIVTPDGAVVFDANGPLEVELRAAIKAAILARGVGVFRTEARVAAAIDAGVHEVIHGLKERTIPVVKAK